MRTFLLHLLIILCAAVPAKAAELTLQPLLVQEPQSRLLRVPFPDDPLGYALATGTWTAPSAQTEGWQVLEPDAEGWYEHEALRGGTACLRVEAKAEGVWLLTAAGAGTVWVNGEVRGGDVYATGEFRLPVLLQKGANIILMQVGRGRLRVMLEEPPAPVFIESRDLTLPDLVRGALSTLAPEPLYLGLTIINASPVPVTDADALQVVAATPQAPENRYGYAPVIIPPLSAQRMMLELPSGVFETHTEALAIELELVQWTPGQLTTAKPAVLQSLPVTLAARLPGEPAKRTFVSSIDGSVQYYAIREVVDAEGEPVEAPLLMSLHGAGVEAIGQARAYGPATWAHLVCPTNRRPFGFDWEDWGMTDALEVLSHAHTHLPLIPGQYYLTGHSMGGHGTWMIAAKTPHLWTAIGPAAGWASFFTYASTPRIEPTTPAMEAIANAQRVSDLDFWLPNLKDMPVYVLHGDADETVPVEEARAIVESLRALGNENVVLYEEPGQGHWYDTDPDTPGANCVDWPPMWEFMRTQSVRQGDGEPEVQSQPFSSLAPFKRVFDNRFVMLYGTQGTAEETAANYARARYDAEQWWIRGNGRTRIIPDSALELDLQSAFATADFADSAAYANLICYGNADTLSCWEVLFGDSPVQVTRSGVALGDHEWAGQDLGVLLVRQHPNDALGYAGLVGATGPAGHQVTSRLRYFLAGVHYPGYTIVSPEVLRNPEAGLLAAGFFNAEGEVD